MSLLFTIIVTEEPGGVYKAVLSDDKGTPSIAREAFLPEHAVDKVVTRWRRLLINEETFEYLPPPTP